MGHQTAQHSSQQEKISRHGHLECLGFGTLPGKAGSRSSYLEGKAVFGQLDYFTE
jgi:hypothetical protein